MYLYDELGTALFEAITLLPEYGLTRAEERLLRRHAGDMLEHLPPPVAVVELGSGSGRKTRWILEALADREPVAYFPIDISAAALVKCHQELGNIGTISMVGLERSYLDGLQEARPVAGRIRHSWYCSWEAPSAILIRRQRRSFCATSAGISGLAMLFYWELMWRNRSMTWCWPMMIRLE